MDKIENIIKASKIYDLAKKEDNKKTVTIVLCCIGALVLVGVGLFVAYKLFFSKEDDYDLYDDLDYYYDDDDDEDDIDAYDEDDVEEVIEAVEE